ncbi:uncharacterized protein LOC100777934 [Anopheles sinensis]|uniref:Uncharacterized protein LOC100777934 n=1 Tax=Anopheles sinensis TaxID=74873 RepID=A0A084W113_ANOSI|nr:uncharacterized protein LOC100777934 [Anopheles sinensis]
MHSRNVTRGIVALLPRAKLVPLRGTRGRDGRRRLQIGTSSIGETDPLYRSGAPARKANRAGANGDGFAGRDRGEIEDDKYWTENRETSRGPARRSG